MGFSKQKFEEQDESPSKKVIPSTLRLEQSLNKPLPILSEKLEQDSQDIFFRNLYHQNIDFQKLSQLSSELRNGSHVCFTDPKSFMSLTKALLKAHFNLELELPSNRLCPPIPNRHNYVLFVKDLLDTTTFNTQPSRLPRVGIDIGTGASAIYPLLGYIQRGWSFIATEADETNFRYAHDNVARNGLSHAIKILGPRDPTALIIPTDYMTTLQGQTFDFLMTNPPFYDSEAELLSCAAKKSQPPYSACTGAQIEMVCPGGEVGFVSRIFRESLKEELRLKIQWYTSLLGRLESVEALVKLFKENGIENYAINELVQGSRTKRWVLAWSFMPMRPAQSVASGVRVVAGKKVSPRKIEKEIYCASLGADLKNAILRQIKGLDLFYWEEKPRVNFNHLDLAKNIRFEVIGRTNENVWSRSWRRRKQREKISSEKSTIMPPDGLCAFGFSVFIRETKKSQIVGVRWREGHNPIIFESFSGYLKRKLTEGQYNCSI